jgi:sec-independent protein translocase protein TatC
MPYVLKPLKGVEEVEVISIAVTEKFVTHFTLACYLGFFISSPYILYQVWAFVSVALTIKEKRAILLYFPISSILFCVGAGFGYIVIVPLGLKFLLGFGSPLIVSKLTISKYISFVGMLTVVFGIIFQLPLAMVFMTRLGIITPKTFSSKRRAVIVLIFIAAAILTPPDVITQVLMAIPLLALYEVGILFSRIVYREKQRDKKETDETKKGDKKGDSGQNE